MQPHIHIASTCRQTSYPEIPTPGAHVARLATVEARQWLSVFENLFLTICRVLFWLRFLTVTVLQIFVASTLGISRDAAFLPFFIFGCELPFRTLPHFTGMTRHELVSKLGGLCHHCDI